MEIKTEVRGVRKLNDFLKKVPRGAMRTTINAFADYILGNERRGLRHDEPQKYVSRKQAGYTTSPAQIRYFFAVGILENVNGEVVLNRYQRTGETAKAWKKVSLNSGYKVVLSNNKAGATRTRSDDEQTRQHALAGRRKVSKVIADNIKGALRHAGAEIKKWLKMNK